MTISSLLCRALVGAGLLTLLPGTSTLAAQETGRIVGRVSDVASGRALSGAQVYLSDETRGGLTDLDGRFVLSGVPVGTHSVVAQMLGYGTKTVTDVEVGPGTTTLNIGLDETAVEIEGITVSAERERGSTASLLDERRTSNALVEAVGATEISRRPDSDAADVAKRMSGVTVSEGKYVFVRGLGERYSQTSLNGSSLPSPEPEKEVIPLDLFPSGVLEALETQKSYTPEQPADFSGGTVKIRTKDFPDDFTIKVGISTSFNTESQFKDGFLHYDGGGTDWLGFDDGTRDQPGALEDRLGGIKSGERLPSGDPQAIVEIGQALRSLGPQFAPETGDTPWNRGIDLSVGGSTSIFDEGEFGYFFAGTYGDSYTRRVDEVERKWRGDAFTPEAAEFARPNVDYEFERGIREISWGTVGNLTLKPSPTQKISLRTTANLNTESEARVFQGTNAEDIGGEVRSERGRFIERLLLWGQLAGEHEIFLDSRLDWRVSGARADRDEPLLRESIYLEGRDDQFFLLDFTESGRYFYSDLVDDDLNAALDWRFPFDLFGGEAAVKFGGSWRERDRDFGARRLNWNFLGSTIPDLDRALRDAEIVASAPRRADQFQIDDVVEPGDVYQATDRRTAGYLMVEVPIGDRLDIVTGARVEDYALELTSRDSLLADNSQTDVAPSVNVVYSIQEDLKLRGAFSQTVDRPEFRELAPFQFTEATSLRQLVGNPGLRSADVTSWDLRLDWFPRAGEIISVGGFHKEMENPIEQVFIAAASTAYSFQNADDATITGLEIDAQIRLDRFAEALEFVSLQGNYSWIDSEVNVRRGGIYQPTNLVRPLQGQASYVVNAGLNYADPRGIEAGLFYNRFGERIEAAGGSGVPDIYEQPRDVVDATLAFPLPGAAPRVKLKATNLLDSDYLFEQSANGITRVQRRYSVGQTFSVGLSWEF